MTAAASEKDDDNASEKDEDDKEDTDDDNSQSSLKAEGSNTDLATLRRRVLADAAERRLQRQPDSSI